MSTVVTAAGAGVGASAGAAFVAGNGADDDWTGPSPSPSSSSPMLLPPDGGDAPLALVGALIIGARIIGDDAHPAMDGSIVRNVTAHASVSSIRTSRMTDGWTRLFLILNQD